MLYIESHLCDEKVSLENVMKSGTKGLLDIIICHYACQMGTEIVTGTSVNFNLLAQKRDRENFIS